MQSSTESRTETKGNPHITTKAGPKVALLTSVHSPFDTRIFYKQARSLARAGYDVRLICPHDREEEVERVKLVPLPRPKGRLKRLLLSPWRVLKLALAQRASIYHFHDPELLPVGVLLRLLGKKVIYDIHEDVAKQILNKEWLPARRLISSAYRLLELLTCRLFPLVLAEASYARLYPQGVRKVIVQNFPETGIFPSPRKQEEREFKGEGECAGDGERKRKRERFTACYLGGVSALRGMERTLEALALLKEKGQLIDFLCIGPASKKYAAHLERRIEELGLTQQVELRGRMEAPRAYTLLQECHVGLAVLQPNPNYFASFPTKMFEYMGLGLPVIVSNFPLWQNVVDQAGCGFTVDPLAAADLAKALATLAADPQQAKEMGEHGRRAIAEEYNWEREEQKLLALYAKLML
jgi:glycosyltransferase involved in cell wall biosynthesis